MRICLISYRGNPHSGGQGVYIHYLSRELVQLGHEVTILVGPPYPDPAPWANVVCIPNHQFWGKRRGFIPRDQPWRILHPLHLFEFVASRLGYFPEPLAFSIRAFKYLKRVQFQRRFDILHDVETLGYGLLLARGSGIPIVATVHHPLTRDRVAHLMQAGSFKERYYNVVFFPLVMQGLVARRLDGVITSSKVGVNELYFAFRVERRKIHLVYSGVDLKTFSPDNRTAREPCQLLFVGNADDPRKGFRYLIEALKSLPPPIHLKVVDHGEPGKTYAPGMVRRLNLQKRVTFTGKLSSEALAHAYRTATVLAMPSLFEGFGLPAAEAMACGTPVIGTRAGAIPEVLGEDQEGGILIAPRNRDALAEAARRVIDRPAFGAELGARGRRRVERLFSWERTARKTAEVYDWIGARMADVDGASASKGRLRCAT